MCVSLRLSPSTQSVGRCVGRYLLANPNISRFTDGVRTRTNFWKEVRLELSRPQRLCCMCPVREIHSRACNRAVSLHRRQKHSSPSFGSPEVKVFVISEGHPEPSRHGGERLGPVKMKTPTLEEGRISARYYRSQT